MASEREIAFEHAWRYFEYHAQQRIAIFNFFVATSGLLVGGLAFTTQAPVKMWPFGLAAGLLLVIVSVAFWRLDQRVSSMIKLSEEVIINAEAQLITDPDLRMISRERAMTASTKFGLFKAWTYGRAFRFIFLSMGIIGALGGAISIARPIFGEVSDKKVSPPGSIAPKGVLKLPKPAPSPPPPPTDPHLSGNAQVGR